MLSKTVRYKFGYRPIIKVLLETLHNSLVNPVKALALIDTGASVTAVPYSLCNALGHNFEKGTVASSVSGVGGSRRTFVHATRLTILEPVINGVVVSPPTPAFEPIDFQFQFIEQHFPYVLLGQKDFLQHFRYVQNGKAGWFSLQRIK
jgi:predicted aspartyl protease